MKEYQKVLIALLVILVLTIITNATDIYTNGINAQQVNTTYDTNLKSVQGTYNSANGAFYYYQNYNSSYTSAPIMNVFDANTNNDQPAFQTVTYSKVASFLGLNHARGTNSNLIYLNWVNPTNEYQYVIYGTSNLASASGHPAFMFVNSNSTNTAPTLVTSSYSATNTTVIQSWRNQTNQVAYVNMAGTFYGSAFVDSTPGFEGSSAIKAVQSMTSKDGKLEDDKLDPFLQAEWSIPVMGKQIVRDADGGVTEVDVQTGTTITKGRNIGNAVTVNSMAIQEIVDELCKKDNSYKFC